MMHLSFDQMRGIWAATEVEFSAPADRLKAYWLVIECLEEINPIFFGVDLASGPDETGLDFVIGDGGGPHIPDPTPAAFSAPGPVPAFLKNQQARDEDRRTAVAEVEPSPENVEVAPEPEVIQTTVAPPEKCKPKKAAPLKTGPYTENEIAFMIQSRDQDRTNVWIANQLNRGKHSVDNKFYNLKKAGKLDPPKPVLEKVKPVTRLPKDVLDTVKKHPERAAPPQAHKSLAEGGQAILPRPHPDPKWTPEDDFDLVSMHHSGSDMATVAINLERDKPECVDRYNALIRAMPETSMQAAQVRLKQTVRYYAEAKRAKGKAA